MNFIDLTSASGAALGLLPEILVTATACLVLLVAGWRHEGVEDNRLAGWLSLGGLVAAGLSLAYLWAGGAVAAGIAPMVALDSFRYAADVIFLLAAAITVALSLGYLERERLLQPEYYGLLLLGTVGMMLLGGATDLIMVFLGLEVMSIAVYVLAAFDRRSAASAEAGLKYFLVGAFASAFLLYGIALLYGATGTSNTILMGAQLSAGPLSLMAGLGLGMLLIGLGFKVSAVPFHMWAPDVYDGAPTPVTGFMATGVKAAGFIALARLLVQGFASAGATWRPVIFGLAIATMVLGNFVALSQRSVKRMLAYSSIAHAGYLLVALWPGSRLGSAALLLYLLAYGITTLAAFGLVAVIGRHGERDLTLDDLAGLARLRPWTAFALAVCMLSLLGFPGTIGFIAKWMVLSAVVYEHQWVLAVVLVLASVVSAGYYLPVIMAMYMKAPEEGVEPPGPFPGVAAAAVALTVAAILVLGVWPANLIDGAMASVTALLERASPLAGR